jgi:hypothetical protein
VARRKFFVFRRVIPLLGPIVFDNPFGCLSEKIAVIYVITYNGTVNWLCSRDLIRVSIGILVYEKVLLKIDFLRRMQNPILVCQGALLCQALAIDFDKKSLNYAWFMYPSHTAVLVPKTSQRSST